MPYKLDYNDTNDNNMSDSDDSYDELDDKIDKYTIQDFLAFPTTKEMLEFDHYEQFSNKVEPKLYSLLSKIYNHCEHTLASPLRLDPTRRGLGTIVGMIYKHVEKKYNIELFKNYPELALPFLIAEKKKDAENKKKKNIK
tara:strand:+ start:53 stop:472 length:420 start_codon:yes stop_codon:yes gene_type:complete